jgi:thiamine-monophosphate kinase
LRPPPDPRQGGEDQLIDWLRRRIRRQSGTAAIAGPLGDDAAILPADSFAVTVDHQIAGVHFPPGTAPAIVARRLLAVNLSDLAAMGATPAYAFLALAAPEGFDHRKFFAALLAACARFGVQLAGGDLARTPERLSASLTLLGTKAGARWVERGGARPGHALWVGGTLGESAAGRLVIERGTPQGLQEAVSSPRLQSAARRAVRRHLAPHPQLALGRWLADQDAGGGMDISDGLARDLHRLCRASGTGAAVNAEDLPFATDFAPLCAALGADPLTLALSGGEDYVLLFTLPVAVVPPAELGARRIGRITRRGVALLRAGIRERLADAGWDHLSAAIAAIAPVAPKQKPRR